MNDLVRALLSLEYRVARLPIDAIEGRLVSRIDPRSPGRTFFERSMNAVDGAVGRILGDAELEGRTARGDGVAAGSIPLAEVAARTMPAFVPSAVGMRSASVRLGALEPGTARICSPVYPRNRSTS